MAPRGRLLLALTITIEGEKIAEFGVIADPARLQQLDLAVLDNWPAPHPATQARSPDQQL